MFKVCGGHGQAGSVLPHLNGFSAWRAASGSSLPLSSHLTMLQ